MKIALFRQNKSINLKIYLNNASKLLDYMNLNYALTCESIKILEEGMQECFAFNNNS